MPQLKIAILMDPMEEVGIEGDTTFDMAMVAHERGHDIWVFQPMHLGLHHGEVMARARKIKKLQRVKGDHIIWAEEKLLNLADVDVVLIRQDPPYDMGYLTTTYMLERLMPDVLVLNNPVEIRNAPEKLFVTEFADLTPKTLITSDPTALRAFRETHKDIILKPLYGNGGAGVFRVGPENENFSSLLEMFSEHYREPVIAQAYLKDVRQGDKRIILLDGEAVGVINRVPAKGEARSNMHVGGRAEAADLSARDTEICNRIGPALKERGLVLVGIDVIGEYLTEINVTSPTGVQEVRNFGGADISSLFWDWVEARRS